MLMHSEFRFLIMDNVSYFTLSLLLCVGIYNAYVSGKPYAISRDREGLIVGGYNTTIENAPYQVYLLILIGVDYFQCGGSIISSKAILTAAHCLTGSSRINIRAGSTLANSGGYMYKTSLYRIHPRYNPGTSEYDVAVIRVRKEMTIDGTTTRIVTLPEEGEMVPTGTNLLVTGWGTTSEGGQTTDNLMAVIVPTVSYETCRESYDIITERMICAGFPEGGKDSCQGDSGGPAVDESTEMQVGIVSFGIGCARPGIPGVYTNVSSVRKWIRSASGV